MTEIPCLNIAGQVCPIVECLGRSDVRACRQVERITRPRPNRPEEQMTGIDASRKADTPSLARKAVTFGLAVTRHVADGARKASTEEQDRRKAACEACPMLDQARDRCSKCGCTFMNLKRSWASESCPDNPPRWEAEP